MVILLLVETIFDAVILDAFRFVIVELVLTILVLVVFVYCKLVVEMDVDTIFDIVPLLIIPFV